MYGHAGFVSAIVCTTNSEEPEEEVMDAQAKHAFHVRLGQEICCRASRTISMLCSNILNIYPLSGPKLLIRYRNIFFGVLVHRGSAQLR